MRPAAPKHSLSVSDFATVGWMIFSRKAHPSDLRRIDGGSGSSARHACKSASVRQPTRVGPVDCRRLWCCLRRKKRRGADQGAQHCSTAALPRVSVNHVIFGPRFRPRLQACERVWSRLLPEGRTTRQGRSRSKSTAPRFVKLASRFCEQSEFMNLARLNRAVEWYPANFTRVAPHGRAHRRAGRQTWQSLTRG
jgi:hypothetical protein